MQNEGTIDLESFDYEELSALVAEAGGQRAFERRYGIERTKLQRRLKRLEQETYLHRPPPSAREEHVTHGVRRFILTSAQDATKLHDGFLDCLETYRDWLATEGPCELLVAGYTYSKKLFEDHDKGSNKVYWPSRIKPYLVYERIRLGDRIDFCGEMNTLPTAVNPLAGFETYTRHRWGIFPHAKVQLKSIPRMKGEPPKVIMTTGSVTKSNYVPKRAGIQASFHHIIGAVLVEIAADGKFFARHLLAEEDGSFCDLDRRITPGQVTEGNRVSSITWGDVHVAQVDPVVSAANWGIYPTEDRGEDHWRLWETSDRPTMLDTLKPRYQFFHDVFDGKARNSHNLKDPHQMFQLFIEKAESMENEARETAMFFCETRREWCESVVVASNHHTQLERWLKSPDAYAHDPLNATFYLRCQLAKYEAIERGDFGFSIFDHLMTTAFSPYNCQGVTFLHEDESFVVNDIEQGNHGHLGANGAKGSPNTFRRMGAKNSSGHVHGPYINDGSMGSGVCQLSMGYNKGLSNWAIAHIVGHENGERQLVFMWEDGEYRL